MSVKRLVRDEIPRTYTQNPNRYGGVGKLEEFYYLNIQDEECSTTTLFYNKENYERIKKMTKDNKKQRFYYDREFLSSPESRAIRVQSEYFGPQQKFAKNNIEDTIVFFGSARFLSREEAKKVVQNAPKNISVQKQKMLDQIYEMSRFYEDARELAYKLTKWSKELSDHTHRYIIASGGGPGIMEASNRGASEAKGLSVGLNITLPFEQSGNKWISEDLNLQFHYFFMRKFWMAYLAKALVVFPGGFGTLDELMEILTLIQTRKMKKTIPIILYGKEFWEKVVNWDYLVEIGTISESDMDLFTICDNVDCALETITTSIKKNTEPGPNF